MKSNKYDHHIMTGFRSIPLIFRWSTNR